MPLYRPNLDKDVKHPKHQPSILETEIRATKRFIDCDKKRSGPPKDKNLHFKYIGTHG